MRRTLLMIVAFLPYLLSAQPRIKNKKYQGLLWEITGNGMNKPSYLFGTMHVSSKMAFHLADSFYLGIRNADMVALETNPESWQEDMSKYDLGNSSYNYSYQNSSYTEEPNDYLGINQLKFYKYDKKVERALYSNPSTINNLLYRTYGNESSDFEEDTYLDMYIYQCGKKWGKKVAGVEKYGESMKLMAEAYKDAAKDHNKRERSYDEDDGYSSNKLQEAYRSGNLDWLDSINKFNSFSAAFDEKFLYKRNEIQANSIDSILRSGQSLFVGVGAAHLPGNRGVIEMLRAMGYKLRPVKMGARDSQHKTQVEKLRVPIQFTSQIAEDGMYKVDIPGKFYKYGEDGSLEQQQYADMANGSYYMVTRFMTNAWMWGHSDERVRKIIDSLLYENIPGKIINKTNIIRNGYHGIDLTNKTRRGDVQRYTIFTTPFEVIIFKMSGTGDYVLNGEEAKRFFGSIQLKEYKPTAELSTTWKKYSPGLGGFSIDLPHEPYVGNDGSWIYDSEDRTTNTHYRVIRTDIHNYRFAEEDTFDLGLLEESFASSDFIDKKLNRVQTHFKGYPALDCKYSDKNGNVYLTRFIIQGPHYYTLVAHGKQETPAMKNFMNSFEIRPYSYQTAKEQKDTSLYFSVITPVFPGTGKEKLDIPNNMGYRDDEDSDSEMDALINGAFRSKVIKNDTTGEKLFVVFYKTPRYFYLEDSTVIDKESFSIASDTSWIYRLKTKYELANKVKVWEVIVTDTGSSRLIWAKTFYKDGIGYSIITQGDTLTPPSSFVKSFFDTFKPADTLKGIDLFAKKSNLFFEDFYSKDSVAHKRAIKGINIIKLDSTDFPKLKEAISTLNWQEKNYLQVKKSLIGKLDEIKIAKASDFLKQLYYDAGDTIDLQYIILESLLNQKNQYAYKTFRDIMVAEPPVLNMNDYEYNGRTTRNSVLNDDSYDYSSANDEDFLEELSDSLKLTKTILPEILPLINLDDYEYAMMQLLGEMVDSNLVSSADYQPYITKFLIEAKQALKKQAIAEKQKAIKLAEESKKQPADRVASDYSNEDDGNDDLELYATLLMSAWETNNQIKPLMDQLLNSKDNKLKYSVMLKLLKSGKPCPDSLLRYFANLDEYRYPMYAALKKAKLVNKFPASYNTHLDLSKSKLISGGNYRQPDSLVYIDRLLTEVKGRKGWVYFYKYKLKKDDSNWKLATVGLVSENPKQFEFDDKKNDKSERNYGEASSYNFTGFSATKLKDDEPILNQLNKQLRKMQYSKRKSARLFYGEGRDEESYDAVEAVVDTEN